jgi:hypothetical protein
MEGTMAGRREHDVAGAIAGFVSALVTAPKSANAAELAMELLGGVLGGRVGSRIPDVLEPAIHSHHRDVCHGLTFAMTALPTGARLASTAQDRLRARADQFRARREASEDGFERLVMAVAEIVCRVAAGFVGAIVPGYASHLALDAGTPRGIPLMSSAIG